MRAAASRHQQYPGDPRIAEPVLHHLWPEQWLPIDGIYGDGSNRFRIGGHSERKPGMVNRRHRFVCGSAVHPRNEHSRAASPGESLAVFGRAEGQRQLGSRSLASRPASPRRALTSRPARLCR